MLIKIKKLSSNRVFVLVLASIFNFAILAPTTSAERLKDIATIQGVQANYLVGYGLVTGLDGTGDQTTQAPFTAESFRSYLNQFGISIPAGQTFQLNNVAAVSVQAELPAFAKPGQRIDITVSSLANAESLRGGTLERVTLQGINGEIYAIAQGNLIVGGLGVNGADGSSITINVPSVGRIPGGASVVKEVPTAFGQGDHITYNLKEADFTTASRVVAEINTKYGSGTASAMDAVSIQVSVPKSLQSRVAFVSNLENIEIHPGESVARVIINSRTGTIVANNHVRITPVAVTHGSLTVTISENYEVSQPNAFAPDGALPVITPQTDVVVTQETNRMFLFDSGVSLTDLVNAFNAIGAAPGDMTAIIEALKQAGALKAELIVI